MMNQTPGNLIQSLEQMESLLRDISRPIGTYYKELMINCGNEQLAHDLVLDYCHIFWSAQMPNKNKEE